MKNLHRLVPLLLTLSVMSVSIVVAEEAPPAEKPVEEAKIEAPPAEPAADPAAAPAEPVKEETAAAKTE